MQTVKKLDKWKAIYVDGNLNTMKFTWNHFNDYILTVTW